MSKAKQYLFPAVAGMAALVGSMNEGNAGTSESVMSTFEFSTTGGAPSVAVASGATSATATFAVPAPATTTKKILTTINVPDNPATSVTLTNITAVANVSTKVNRKVYLLHPGTAGTATVTLQIAAPRCGDTYEFYDVTTFTGARTYTPALAAAVGSAWDDATQNQYLAQPHTVIWYGPVKPAYTAQTGGCKLVYKAKTSAEMIELYMKKFA